MLSTGIDAEHDVMPVFPSTRRPQLRRHGKGARASPNSDAIRVLIGDGGRRGYPRQARMTSGILADTRDDADATNADACYAVTTLAAVQSHRWTHIAGYTWAVHLGIHMAEKTWTQTAIIPTKRAIEVRAAASSTTARNIGTSLNEERT